MFATQFIAEDRLIDLWSKNDYVPGHAPITVYKCEDCGAYHLTSQGTMNERLMEEIKSGRLKLQKEAKQWEDKLKKR